MQLIENERLILEFGLLTVTTMRVCYEDKRLTYTELVCLPIDAVESCQVMRESKLWRLWVAVLFGAAARIMTETVIPPYISFSIAFFLGAIALVFAVAYLVSLRLLFVITAGSTRISLPAWGKFDRLAAVVNAVMVAKSQSVLRKPLSSAAVQP